MITARQAFCMGICYFGQCIHAMEPVPKFPNVLFNSKVDPMLVDTTEWSIEPETRNLINALEKSRSTRTPQKPIILFHGQNSYNVALTLADKLNAKYLVIEPDTFLENSFINQLQRPAAGLHTIIIKHLSALLTTYKEKTMDTSNDHSVEEKSAISRFSGLVQKLRTSSTYLICTQGDLSKIPEAIKIIFLQTKAFHLACIAKAEPNKDQLYYEMLWPFFNKNKFTKLMHSLGAKQYADYGYSDTAAVNKLIDTFKENRVSPQGAHLVMEGVKVSDGSFWLNDVIEKINLLKLQHKLLQLTDTKDPQLPSMQCIICLEDCTNYSRTACCEPKESESDRVICSTCVNTYYKDKKNIQCITCNTIITVQPVFKLELVPVKEIQK